eukprot:CAMPEP_0119039938 /NCGR_PEP_ID=MMETSP1177-20130426/9717_1 /TAXON_ID=2985 /ORGANISM="Ochromonas sp, Strain CCMP1899" /LENGTH=514 /DNA_ID=CAMNT_0007004491 /DNA_START=290 /DNA_END=1834 /DNA_ORIENTATION=-
MPEAELIKIIGDYEGLVVRSATKVNATVLAHATRLRIVGRAGVGVDNIDIKEATKRGVMVMNTPGGNTVSTAQLAISLMAALARKVPAADMMVKEGKWDKKQLMGVEMQGKTLGVVGCGRIGQVVASCAQTMGMHVIGYDPVMTPDQFQEVGIERADLEDIWAKSDFITVHTPLTPETSNLIGDATLAKCKEGVRIVNCARGGIVDEAALLRGLQSGKVAGAALDVFTSEPPKEHLRTLIAHPNLVCTPHLGASTDEAQVNVARDIAVQMCDVFDAKDYVGIVNVSYMAAANLPHVKPFKALAEIIGSIQSQLSESPIRKMELKTWGGRDVNITSKPVRSLLEAVVLKGIVKYTKGMGMPDLISAPAMAREAGIESCISLENPDNIGSPYMNLLSVMCTREDGTKSVVTGAVFGSIPHIVQVDDYSEQLSFKPESNYVLTFRNEDRPGAISDVLQVLNNANVNVASMNVTRAGAENADQKAICFMALDDDVPTNAMVGIRSLKGLQNVAKIQLR